MAVGENVRHGVGLTGNVRDLVMVPIVVAVEAGQVTEIGGGLVRGDSTFSIPRDGSDIVIESGDSQFLKVIKACSHVGLGEHASLLCHCW